MLIIKALTKMYDDWGEDIDDFYITYSIEIGPSEINGASDMFSFELVSPKRLDRMTDQGDIIIGHGHFIAKDFNENTLKATRPVYCSDQTTVEQWIGYTLLDRKIV
ncbi:Imm8 family immunity protein, partial [Paenibacillus polymyxa]|uniref:Imm8 family immunity protein n=1 Tax=Paenibacillus polymyxa TaxID=1406 RepID=UPI0004722B93